MRQAHYRPSKQPAGAAHAPVLLWPILAIGVVVLVLLVVLPLGHRGLWSFSEALLAQPLVAMATGPAPTSSVVNPVYWSLLQLLPGDPGLMGIRALSLLAAIIGLLAYAQFVLKLTHRPRTALWSALIVASSWAWLRAAHMEPNISFWFTGLPVLLGCFIPEVTKTDFKPSPFSLIASGLLGFGVGVWALGVTVWGLLFGLIISLGVAITHPKEIALWFERLLHPKQGGAKTIGKNLLCALAGLVVAVLLGLTISLVTHADHHHQAPYWMQYFFNFQAVPILDNLGHVLQMGWDALPWIVVTPVAVWSAMSLKDQAIPAVLASNLCWWVLCALLGAVLLPSGISGGTLGVILPLAIGLGALIEAGVDRYWAPKPYRLWTDGLIVFCLLGAVGFTVVLFQVLPDELPSTQWQTTDVMAPAAAPIASVTPSGDLSAGPVAPAAGPTSKLSETKAKLSGYVAGIPLWKLKFLYFPVIGLFCGLALFVLSILQQAGLTPWVMVTMSWLSALGLFCVAMPAYHPDSSQSLVHWFNTLRPQASVLWLPQDFAAPVQGGDTRPLAQEVRRYTSLTNVFKNLPPSQATVAPESLDASQGNTESMLATEPATEQPPPKMQWALVDEVAYYRLPWTQRSGWSVRGYFMVPKSPLNRLFLQASPYGLGPRQLLLVQGLPQELLPDTTDSASSDFSGSVHELR